ncbi:hypothetical protein FHX42_004180 [Saccharopolyspora lacisalsi]|uniref:Uncharacterized protein n=1 Tax=Halosaccharopolyspora lacisalsi TaxID=1000566 RepID=A0A839E649_9PSEU|nr:hypothetical protein [Halosaccharopolyspora lacisalsi]
MHIARVTVQRRTAIGARTREVGLEEMVAVRGAAPDARAAAAARVEGEHDLIAGSDTGDAVTDGFRDPRTLVTEHGRQRHRVPLVADDQVGVAHAGSDHSHEDLTRRGTSSSRRRG